MHSHLFFHGLHALSHSPTHAHTRKHQDVCEHADVSIHTYCIHTPTLIFLLKTSKTSKGEVFGKKV